MIPQNELNPAAVQMLMEYLQREIYQAMGERAELEEDWITFLKAYRARPPQTVKTFPFYGSSNLVIPVVATDVDVVIARFMGILFAPENFFSAQAKQPAFVEFAPRLQEFLQAVQYTELNVYNVARDFVSELVKLGTSVIKTRYRREQRTIFEQRELGGQTISGTRTAMVKDNPEFSHVSLFDFYQPSIANDIKGAPWVAERVLLTWQQYINRVNAGIYMPVPRLAEWSASSQGSQVLQEAQNLDLYRPGRTGQLEFFECWLNFDVSGTATPRAIVATIHLPTMSFVRLDWNPYLSQEAPYDFGRYLTQEKRFYGIGLIEMLIHFQDEITAMHNQRIDSGTLANSMMFKGRAGAVSDDEPIFPGRWFILDNLEDVQPLALTSGKFDSSIQYEPATLDYARRRSGVNEHVAGQFAPSIGYAAAHTNIQQLQQATQRFDQTLREIRNAFGGAVIKAVELYQQFDSVGKFYSVLGEKDGKVLEQIINFPTHYIRDGVGIGLTATSGSLNKELEIRTSTIQLQQIGQFYQQILDGMMIAYNPNIPEPVRMLVLQMIQGASILMRRILEAQGTQDTDDIVPHINDILSSNYGLGQLGGQTLGGGIGGAQGGASFPGGFGAIGQTGGIPRGFLPAQSGGGIPTRGNVPYTGGGTI